MTVGKTKKSIAVIGSGVAGLTTAHLLQREHRVTLFEKADRLGGHTNTFVLPDGPDAGTAIDTGFIVMNHRNYPLLTKLFDQLNGLFAQRRNLIRPTFHRMLCDVFRFFRIAKAELENNLNEDETLREFLQRHKMSEAFIQHHLIPMGSAIWSTPSEQRSSSPPTPTKPCACCRIPLLKSRPL